jgi:hypothetical protein
MLFTKLKTKTIFPIWLCFSYCDEGRNEKNTLMGHGQKLNNNIEGDIFGTSENVTLSFIHHCLVFEVKIERKVSRPPFQN